MAFAQIAGTIPQYEDFPNYFMKAFIEGTVTPKVMATDITGSTTVSKFELSGLGHVSGITGSPITEGNALVIPFIDGSYDLWIFPTAAEADANDTTNAIQLADNIIGFLAGKVANQELTTAAMAAETNNIYIAGLGVIETSEFSTGKGGGAVYDAVLTSGVTPNGLSIIIGTANPLVSFVLREFDFINAEAFGAVGDGATNDNTVIALIAGGTTKVVAEKIYKITSIPADLSVFRGLGHLVDASSRKIPIGEDYKDSVINSVRPIPDTDLSWLTILPKVDAVGDVTPTEGVQHFAIRTASVISAGEVWIDPVNGSDANAGSPGLPIKTLNEALRVRSASRIFMMGSNDRDNPAIFTKSDFRDTDAVGNRIKIVNAQGHCRIAEPIDDFSALTWTNEPATSVYKATTTSLELNQLRYTKAKDEDGGFLKIDKIPFNTDLATTITDVNNSVFGWFHNIGTNTLYVRIGGFTGTVFRDFIEGVVSTAASRCLFLNVEILFYAPEDSSITFDGITVFTLNNASSRTNCFLHAEDFGDIVIQNTFTHGLDSNGSLTMLQNVKGISTGGDNFHYFDSAGVECRALEINCESSFAGDFGSRGTAAAGTDNGSAMHGTGHIARYGGRYFKNNGPDIVDSGTGAFWNAGVEAYGSTLASNAIGFDITAGSGRMYLDTCLARDEDLDEIQVNAGAVLRTFNTTGIVNEVSTGIEVAYDPLNI